MKRRTLFLIILLAGIFTTNISKTQNIKYEGVCGENLIWQLTYDGLFTVSGNGEMDDYYVLMSPWYFCKDEIFEIIIGDSVTTIGDWAFYRCSWASSLTIGESVITIGESAFESCASLTALTIPNSVVSVGNRAFRYCQGLIEISLSNSLTSIKESTFMSCVNLQSAVIPNSVETIEGTAFFHCRSLISIILGESLVSIGIGAFQLCESLTSIIIPDAVISIETHAFAQCYNLLEVIIGNSVTEIGYGVFSNCNSLETITIGSSYINLFIYVADKCYNLTTIIVHPDNPVYSSNDGILYDKNQKKLIFCPRGKSSVSILNSVTVIDNGAFEDCKNLTTVIIPDSVEIINSAAFSNCKNLSEISIPNMVTAINSRGFAYCDNLVSVTFGNSLVTIGYEAFNMCNIYPDLIIPNSVTEIFEYAFHGNSELKSVTIGSSVAVIKEQAFQDCRKIETIICLPETPPVITSNSFSTVPRNIPVLVPCGSIDYYQNANYWKTFTNFQVIDNPSPENVTVTQENTELVISWKNTDAASYEIFRNGLYLETIDQSQSETTDYIDTDVENGITYCYKIKAIYETCKSAFTKEVCKKFIIVNIDENSINLKIYPNPTTGEIQIFQVANHKSQIEIFDINGCLLTPNPSTIWRGAGGEVKIDISHLPSGFYFLKVGDETVPIVKQ